MGRVFRLIRGDTNLPLSGAPGTLRAMYYKKSGNNIKPLLEIVTYKLLNGVQIEKLRLGAFINMEARQKIKHPYIMMIKQYCSQSKK